MVLIWAKLTKLVIAGILFPLTIKPPGDDKFQHTLFLAGAGKRGEMIGGEYVAHTIDALYLEGSVVDSLSHNWGGVSSEELEDTVGFYRDIYNGHFEKITRVTFINQVSGKKYSDAVTEKCVALWKATGKYNKVNVEAIKKFKYVFKTKTFRRKSSIFYTHSPTGTLRIGFSKDGTLPKSSSIVIRSEALTKTILELIIGKNGLSPATKNSLAVRLAKLMD